MSNRHTIHGRHHHFGWDNTNPPVLTVAPGWGWTVVTTGIGPGLVQNAKDAVSGMIDLLSGRHGLPAAEAYMPCSACADLRISEIVDQPNWVASLYFPKIVFD